MNDRGINSTEAAINLIRPGICYRVRCETGKLKKCLVVNVTKTLTLEQTMQW
jgi:hypothetical protein